MFLWNYCAIKKSKNKSKLIITKLFSKEQKYRSMRILAQLKHLKFTAMKGNLVLQAVTFNQVRVKLLLFYISDIYKDLFLMCFPYIKIDILNTSVQIKRIQF